jgi:hypothetical protein
MRLFFLTALVLAACTSNATIQPNQSGTKKLLEYGWNSPKPSNFDPQKLEASVFDGAMLRVDGDETLFGTQALPTADFEKMQNTLIAKTTKKLENSFLSMNVYTDANWDWFDDAHWAAAESNIRNYARTAKRAGLRGLMFDSEPYSKNPWLYRTQPKISSQSFAAYQQKVRERGAAFMRVVQEEYPGVTILNLFLLSNLGGVLEGNPDDATLQKNLEEDWSGLWGSFVNGWLETASNDVKLIEGNEYAYYYLNAGQFDNSAKTVQDYYLRLVDPALREKYKTVVRIGQALYIDGVANLWKSPRFIGFYFESGDDAKRLLEHNTYHALRTTDEFVWAYGENVRWFTRAEPLEATLRSALDKHRADQPLGFTTEFIDTAKQKFQARVSFGGTITKNGQGVKATRFETSIDGLPCVSYGDEGKYDCTFPAGWSGTVKPIVEGQTLEPAERSYTNLTKSTWNESYIVK